MFSNNFYDVFIRIPNQEKNQNPRRKGNLKILRNIKTWHHQTSTDERKNLKSVSGRTRKLLVNKKYCKNIIKMIKTCSISERTKFGKRTREHETDDDASGFTFQRWMIKMIFMCQEKKEKDDSLGFKITSIRWLEDYIKMQRKTDNSNQKQH